MIGERRNCDPGLVLSIDFTRCDGEYFRSQDAYGNKVQMIGNLWRLDGAKLNGSSDYFVVPDRDNLSFGDGTNDKPFSISDLVNMDDATDFTIFYKRNEYFLGTFAGDYRKIYFYLYDHNVGNRIGRKYDTLLTSYEGQRIHLVATYDATGLNSGINIYLNGVAVDDSDSSAGTYVAMENLAHDVWIGRYSTNYANGKIGNIKLWNRIVGIVENSRRRFENSRKQ